MSAYLHKSSEKVQATRANNRIKYAIFFHRSIFLYQSKIPRKRLNIFSLIDSVG